MVEHWFIAAERRPLMWNRFYKVFITDEMLSGAKARITAFSDARALVADPINYVERATPTVYSTIDVTKETFRTINKTNFQIPWRDIASIEYSTARKTGLGFLPQAGSITFRMRSGVSRELVLLGSQDGEALKRRLEHAIETSGRVEQSR
ncbi:MAG TPA: hypothetical protein VNH44_01580 [Micropepsaceae bacterium]|nr:hypothetical protein [Micropepsaceae bacterium]